MAVLEGMLPAWFEADKVFCNNGNWYFGSIENLHVGPYAERAVAESKSKLTAKDLKSLKTDGERLRYVRKLLHDEWTEIKKGADSARTTLVDEIDVTPPPTEVRRGEQQKNWYRSARFFQVDGVWFFATREGIDVGPFDSEVEAKRHERRLISMLIKAKTPEEAHRTIYEYKHRPSSQSTIEFVPHKRYSRSR